MLRSAKRSIPDHGPGWRLNFSANYCIGLQKCTSYLMEGFKGTSKLVCMIGWLVGLSHLSIVAAFCSEPFHSIRLTTARMSAYDSEVHVRKELHPNQVSLVDRPLRSVSAYAANGVYQVLEIQLTRPKQLNALSSQVRVPSPQWRSGSG